MAPNYTAITNGAAANAAIINAPIGQLDTAMGDVATLTLTGTSIVSGIGTAAPTTTAQTRCRRVADGGGAG